MVPRHRPGHSAGHGRERRPLCPLTDQTLSPLAGGFTWLPQRMSESAGRAVPTRLLGRPALALRGPAAVRFFYDARNVRRDGALPEPVRADRCPCAQRRWNCSTCSAPRSP